LLEVYLLQTQKITANRDFIILSEEEANRKAIDISNSAKYFDILSAGIGSRSVLLKELLMKGTHIRLLSYHPDFAVAPDAEKRIEERVKWVLNEIPVNLHGGLEPFYYQKPASMRLILAFSDPKRENCTLALVSWYNYEHVDRKSSGSLIIRGSNNPTVCLSGDVSAHNRLINFAKQVFESYWQERCKPEITKDSWSRMDLMDTKVR
jgi:hypothetical protein